MMIISIFNLMKKDLINFQSDEKDSDDNLNYLDDEQFKFLD